MESTKIAIKTNRGMEFLRTEDILYCMAMGRYTKIVTRTGKAYILSKILKDIEVSLPSDIFFRTHKSYLINLNHLITYQQHAAMPIILRNDNRVQLAKRRKHAFIQRISELTMTL